ncbi:MAG: helix-turn-helix domain-containing protein [Prolixibacteraceae bacterium]|nr:helix-turn-helix domain-containing protein [Prolixibacteraceae bacterium]
MCADKITFDKLPEAVAFLIQEVSQIRELVEKNKPQPAEKRRPIEIDEACSFVKKAKPTIYALVRKGLIPCYKNGKKLYFFEDELMQWISNGKKKTIDEIKAEIESELFLRRPRKSYAHNS